MGIQTALDAVRGAERLVDAMRLADDLAFQAGRDGGVRTIRILAAAVHGDDQLVAIAAVHALGKVSDEQADAVLTGLLSHEHRFLREHAAWVLQSRLPLLEAFGRLIDFVAAGGFGGMIAQRTLERWSTAAGPSAAVALEGALVGVREEEARARLVETLGLVRDRIATGPLLRVAGAPTEPERVRAAAVMALGQRRGDERIAGVLDGLSGGTGPVADVARLALVDLAAAPSPRAESVDGLTVAQLFLHADVDADLSAAGSGDNGGIATLLVRLGDALVEPGGPVQRVLTMSRGSAVDALHGVVTAGSTDAGHLYGRIPLMSDPVASAAAWPLRVAAQRGIRRILRAAGGVDVLHLRMADVGSLAASDVARELEIPVVFTVAPDPHAVIQSLDLAGRLTRATFGLHDEVEHFWFRARLVQRLASSAAHTVLFPRPDLEQDMRSLVGIDITAHPERHTVVPEGVDLGLADRAVAEAAAVSSGAAPTGALEELRSLLAALPEGRRGLPLLISVGRLHRVKGMATIVEAWASGPLADRVNLLLVGGDLDRPSADEREQIDAIDALVPEAGRGAAGLLLPGHRHNDTVARWMAAARFGLPSLAAPGGVYVCGSLKEEFGIALLEAMATGLLVVAPDGGGPATYVVEGDTGFLTRTWDVGQLRRTLLDALDTAAAEPDGARAERSRATVERDFTIQAMARALTTVYTGVREEERLMRQLVSG